MNGKNESSISKILGLPLYLIPSWIFPIWFVIDDGFTSFNIAGLLVMCGVTVFCLWCWNKTRDSKIQKVKSVK